VLQFASISFDAAVFDLAMALGSGATLHLAPPAAILPGAPLLRTLREQAITIVTLPPSALIATPDADLPALEVITVAGEACPAELVDRWARAGGSSTCMVPTEATIWATATRARAAAERPRSAGRSPTPKPTCSTSAGAGADRRGGRTASRRCRAGAGLSPPRRPDPRVVRAAPVRTRGARLYKTAIARACAPTASSSSWGGSTPQVKVRGYRIELGEIDARLAELPGVEQAVTVVGGALDAARLLAYVTPRAGASPAAHELRAGAAGAAAEFMVPSVVTVLDALPLTPSAKSIVPGCPPRVKPRQWQRRS
jgi:non-ribosomal peptide synthetase component F